MNRFKLLDAIGLVALLLVACGSTRTISPQATATSISATATYTPVTPAREISAVPFPFQEPGTYDSSRQGYTIVDESRNNREIKVDILYPATKQTDADGQVVTLPDTSAAPYPLILTEPNSGDILFKSHLVSHGFVMAIVRFPDSYDNWDFGVVDHPRDMLFALEQIASNPPEDLEGIIDTNRVGVAGYSWGGFYALAVSGVRIDPSSYLNYCDQISQTQQDLPRWYLKYACGLAANWDKFEAHVGSDVTAGEDGLWQAITDERIRAVMPMAPDGAWLYGERGLAMADRPVFIIEGAEDEQAFEAEYIFHHLDTPDCSMVSFIGKGHMMVFEPDKAAIMRHFAVAFFGYNLQGREDYAEFFSEPFVSQFEDLTWVPHTEP